MAQTDMLYEDVKRRILLRDFTRIVNQPCRRLRDDRRASAQRASAAAQDGHLEQRVWQAALEAPTYDYQPLWRLLRAQGVWVGRERLTPRVSLWPIGLSWVYLIEDVASRVCLASPV